jgi:proteasome lid subunit RPN8/RPN11
MSGWIPESLLSDIEQPNPASASIAGDPSKESRRQLDSHENISLATTETIPIATTAPPTNRFLQRFNGLKSRSRRPAGLVVPPIFMPQLVIETIWASLDPSVREPEAGGLLLGRQGTDNLVLDFCFDEEAVTTRTSYTLGTKFLNRVLAEARPAGLDGKGVIHTHPSGLAELSAGDLAYAEKVFAHAPGVEIFLMPVIADREIFPWVVSRHAPQTPVLSTIVII